MSLPFFCLQVLHTRARKDADISETTVPVQLFAFDCLYLNGKSLLAEPLSKRRKALHSAIKVGAWASVRGAGR